MKLFNPELAKRELKEYGLYEDTGKDYRQMKIEINKTLPYLYSTNTYYKNL